MAVTAPEGPAPRMAASNMVAEIPGGFALELDVGEKAVLEPAADVVAGDAAAMEDFVMAASAAQIARPAGAAGFLAVHVAFAEPEVLPLAIEAGFEAAHGAERVFDEAVAGGEIAGGGDAEIAGAGATRVGAVSAAVQLAERLGEIGEGVAPARDGAADELVAAAGHLFEHGFEMPGFELEESGGRGEHGREAGAVKAEAEEVIERGAEVEVLRGHGDARRDLHPVLHPQQRRDVLLDAAVGGPAIGEDAKLIVLFGGAVHADGEGEGVAFEELAVVFAHQRAVGGEGEAGANAGAFGEFGGEGCRLPDEAAVNQRLSAEKGDDDARTSGGFGEQRPDGLFGDGPGHVAGGRAEASALGVAVAAGKVAGLGNGKGERAEGWVLHGFHRRGGVRIQAEAGEGLVDVFGRGGERVARRGVDVVEARAVGEEEMVAFSGAEQVQRRMRRPGLVHEAGGVHGVAGGAGRGVKNGMPMPCLASWSPSSKSLFMSVRARAILSPARRELPSASSE